ncbi:hypothetical protein [Trabulsiella odontotermitis]|uniref:hypothetical protein n=1 Tax=Trabulsiella odontotermitis TaxID=379893 RepID=UPI000676AD90|nr:hypothetical protein [Trabulsiella odontotermitis]KNC88627.1 hypothetical protein GM30_12305 [Trabulsiella odontotermitis]
MNNATVVWITQQVVIFLPAVLCVFLGYRLLMKGLFDGEPNIITAWGNNRRLILKRSTPGFLFVVIGLGMIALNLNSDAFLIKSTDGPQDKTGGGTTTITLRDGKCESSNNVGISSCAFTGEYITDIQSASR